MEVCAAQLVVYACEEELERQTQTAYFMICNSDLFLGSNPRQFTGNHFISLVPTRSIRPP